MDDFDDFLPVNTNPDNKNDSDNVSVGTPNNNPTNPVSISQKTTPSDDSTKKPSKLDNAIVEFIENEIAFEETLRFFVGKLVRLQQLYTTHYLKDKSKLAKVNAIWQKISDEYKELFKLSNTTLLKGIKATSDQNQKLKLLVNYISNQGFTDKRAKLKAIAKIAATEFESLLDKKLIKPQEEIAAEAKETIAQDLTPSKDSACKNNCKELNAYLQSIFQAPFQKFQRYDLLVGQIISNSDFQDAELLSKFNNAHETIRSDLNNLNQTHGRKTNKNPRKYRVFRASNTLNTSVPAPKFQIFLHDVISLCDFCLQTGKGKSLASEYSLIASPISSHDKKLIQKLKNYLLSTFFNLYQSNTSTSIQSDVLEEIKGYLSNLRNPQTSELLHKLANTLEIRIGGFENKPVTANTKVIPIPAIEFDTAAASSNSSSRSNVVSASQINMFHQFISFELNEKISNLLIKSYTNCGGIKFSKNAWKSKLVEKLRVSLIRFNDPNLPPLPPEKIWQTYVDILYDTLDSYGKIPYTQIKGNFRKHIDDTIEFLDNLCPNLMESAKDKLSGKKDNQDLVEHVQQSTSFRANEKNKTSENLLANILRVNNYYCNNRLGILIADQNDIPQNNKKNKWINEINKLSEDAANIYLTLSQPESLINFDQFKYTSDAPLEKNKYYLRKELVNNQSVWMVTFKDINGKDLDIDVSHLQIDTILATDTSKNNNLLRDTLASHLILDKMKSTVENIRRQTFGKNSRLANHLTLLFRGFSTGRDQLNSLNNSSKAELLSSGVLEENMSSDKAEHYIKLHFLEQIREQQQSYEVAISKRPYKSDKSDASSDLLDGLFLLKKDIDKKTPLEFISSIGEVFAKKLQINAYGAINPLYFKNKFGDTYVSIIKYLSKILPAGKQRIDTLTSMLGPTAPADMKERVCFTIG